MPETITINDIEVPVGTHQGKTVVTGSDHRGFALKEKIIEKVQELGFNVIDVGTFSSERCDYPIISNQIAGEMIKDLPNSVGIGICGSGIGISIPAAKCKGIYPARCISPEEAEMSRKHNNTNFLGLGADFLEPEKAAEVVEKWLKTPFYSDPENEQAYLMRYVQTVMIESTINQAAKQV